LNNALELRDSSNAGVIYRISTSRTIHRRGTRRPRKTKSNNYRRKKQRTGRRRIKFDPNYSMLEDSKEI
jgi:hypothetical protein